MKTDSSNLVNVHRCLLSGHRPLCFRPPCFRPHGRSQPAAACLLNWCTTNPRRRWPHLRACCCAKYNLATDFTNPLLIYIGNFLSEAELGQLLYGRYSDSRFCKFVCRQSSNRELWLSDVNIADFHLLVFTSLPLLRSFLKILTPQHRMSSSCFLPSKTRTLRPSPLARSHSSTLCQEFHLSQPESFIVL